MGTIFRGRRRRFTDRRRKFRVSTAQVQEQEVPVHGQAAQVPGVNGAGSKTGAEPVFRESAFYVALVVQVPALK